MTARAKPHTIRLFRPQGNAEMMMALKHVPIGVARLQAIIDIAPISSLTTL